MRMVTDAVTLVTTISRVRRAMPRNADVMLVCDELEALVRVAPEKVTGAAPKRDRAAYMRVYRASRKGGHGGAQASERAADTP